MVVPRFIGKCFVYSLGLVILLLADDHSMESDYYTTVEEAALFQKCFPLLVEEHNLKKSAKTTKRKGKNSVLLNINSA